MAVPASMSMPPVISSVSNATTTSTPRRVSSTLNKAWDPATISNTRAVSCASSGASVASGAGVGSGAVVAVGACVGSGAFVGSGARVASGAFVAGASVVGVVAVGAGLSEVLAAGAVDSSVAPHDRTSAASTIDAAKLRSVNL